MRKPKVTIAYMSRGCDLVYSAPAYVLAQERHFGEIQLLSALSVFGSNAEFLFEGLSELDTEFIHLIDADISPTLETTRALVSHDVDICSAPVWVYDEGRSSLHLNIAEDCEKGWLSKPRKGLEQIFGATFSNLVIKKRVIDAFTLHSESFTEKTELVKDFLYDSTEGIFFMKAKRLGFKCYVDWDLSPCTHNRYALMDAPDLSLLVNKNGKEPHQVPRGQRTDPVIPCAV